MSRSPVDHVWVEERLSAYIDRQLAADERARVDAHLRDCARCQAGLASLQWTIGLVKQSPAPALPRSFTLRAPAPRVTPSAFPFPLPALRFATAFATLLLVALVGVDFIMQFGGGMQTASAPVAEKFAAPTQAALAPPQPTAAPPTAAARAAQPLVAATPTADLKSANDAAQKPSPVPPAPAAGVAVTATLAPTRAAIASPTAPAPTATVRAEVRVEPTRTAVASPTAPAPAPAPTATVRVEARVEPTRAVESAEEMPRVAVAWLRIAEIGLLVIVVGLGIALGLARSRHKLL